MCFIGDEGAFLVPFEETLKRAKGDHGRGIPERPVVVPNRTISFFLGMAGKLLVVYDLRNDTLSTSKMDLDTWLGFN